MLHFDPAKDDEVEWRYQPPAFIPAFVELVEKLGCIPSQAEYVEHYVARHRDALRSEFALKWTDVSVRNQKKRALIARLERAYPSFVRDFYLLALLRENDLAADYDPAQDVQGGVDLVVLHGKQKLQVHVYLDSPRSKQGRAKKDKRHTFAGQHLDIVLRPSECKRVGKFWLPTSQHVQLVKRALGVDTDEH
jgi:hypothetical protein